MLGVLNTQHLPFSHFTSKPNAIPKRVEISYSPRLLFYSYSILILHCATVYGLELGDMTMVNLSE